MPSEKSFLTSILFDLELVKYFVDEEVQVKLPEFDYTEIWNPVQLFFSPTIFERSDACYRSGNCCTNSGKTSWVWFPGDKKPNNIHETPFQVNNNTFQLSYNQTSGKLCNFYSQCDDGQKGCSLHISDEKPLHCRIHLHTEFRKHGNKIYITRTHPGRNWRWPKCPVVWKDHPFTIEWGEKELANLRRLKVIMNILSIRHKLDIAIEIYQTIINSHSFPVPYPIEIGEPNDGSNLYLFRS